MLPKPTSENPILDSVFHSGHNVSPDQPHLDNWPESDPALDEPYERYIQDKEAEIAETERKRTETIKEQFVIQSAVNLPEEQ